jgi:branched-chain amino acid transport system permease protein
VLAQQLTNGLVLGSIYTLASLGFTLIYGAARVVNFAYGEMLMLGAFVTLMVMNGLGIDFFIALPLAMAVMAAASVAIYLVIVRPVIRRTELQVLLVTTGLLYVLHDMAVGIWGTDPRQMDMGLDGVLEIGDVVVPYQRLVVVATMLVLVAGLYLMLYHLRVGKALRAVAQNRFGAQAIGLNVNRVVSFAFAVSGALACAAGALLGGLYAVDPGMGSAPMLKSFVIVIFGGLGSVPGAIVGGLVIGLTETLTGSYISYGFKDVFTFIIMIAMLLLRPQGLLGARRT